MREMSVPVDATGRQSLLDVLELVAAGALDDSLGADEDESVLDEPPLPPSFDVDVDVAAREDEPRLSFL
jgi:hypothetical protein